MVCAFGRFTTRTPLHRYGERCFIHHTRTQGLFKLGHQSCEWGCEFHGDSLVRGTLPDGSSARPQPAKLLHSATILPKIVVAHPRCTSKMQNTSRRVDHKLHIVHIPHQ